MDIDVYFLCLYYYYIRVNSSFNDCVLIALLKYYFKNPVFFYYHLSNVYWFFGKHVGFFIVYALNFPDVLGKPLLTDVLEEQTAPLVSLR